MVSFVIDFVEQRFYVNQAFTNHSPSTSKYEHFEEVIAKQTTF